jgi:hypothetical protein
MMQPVKRCAGCGGEGLTAYFALVTSFFAAVNNDVVLADFASCGAGHIRAELLSRVHVACSSKVVEPLECHRTFIFSTSTIYWSATPIKQCTIKKGFFLNFKPNVSEMIYNSLDLI